MISKDVKSYADSNWGHFLSPITDLSKSETGVSLVTSPNQLYNFDDISKSLYLPGKAPTSVDGLDVSSAAVKLVEFKSGFKQRITKHNFDPAQGLCKDANKLCEEYWTLFFQNQKTNIQDLISSIRFKAIESYITFEKQVFPHCQDARTLIPIKLVVVIDEDEVDGIEDTYSELAGNAETECNHFSAIRKALRRLTNLHDANGTSYFYDSIEVLSVQDYLNKLKLMA